MTEPSSTGRDIAKGAGLLFGHLSAAVLGLVLMIIGSALGVSLVLLPIGVPVGLLGLGLFLWGLFGWASGKTKPGKP